MNSPRLMRDLLPGGAAALAGIRRHKKRVVVSDGVNDIGIAWSFSGSGHHNSALARTGRGGRKRTVSDRCPSLRSNCGPVESSNHSLASRDKVRWRRRIHTEGGEKVAGTIVIKLMGANVVTRVRRRPLESSKGSRPIHSKVPHRTIHRIDEIVGGI